MQNFHDFRDGDTVKFEDMFGKLVNLEAERATLGSVLVDPESIEKVIAILDSHKDFYWSLHQEVYLGMADLFAEGEPIDHVTLSNLLMSRNQHDAMLMLSDLTTSTPTSIYADHYAGVVAELSLRRRLFNLCQKLTEMLFDGKTFEECSNFIMSEVYALGDSSSSPIVSARQAGEEFIQELNARLGGEKNTGAHATGLAVDMVTGGRHEGKFILTGGESSMGKTAFALQELYNMAKGKLSFKAIDFKSLITSDGDPVDNLARAIAEVGGVRCAVITGEMTVQELTERMISAISLEIDTSTAIQYGDMHDEKLTWDDQPALFTANLAFSALPLDFYASTMELGEITSTIIRLAARGVKFIDIDYAQLITIKGFRGGRADELIEVGRKLMAMTRKLGVGINLLSQVPDMSDRKDKRPGLYDHQLCRQLAQPADAVRFIYRDEYHNEETDRVHISDIIVAKNRITGPKGTVSLYHRLEYNSFHNLEIQRTDLDHWDTGWDEAELEDAHEDGFEL